jgi:hypothetical protein
MAFGQRAGAVSNSRARVSPRTPPDGLAAAAMFGIRHARSVSMRLGTCSSRTSGGAGAWACWTPRSRMARASHAKDLRT